MVNKWYLFAGIGGKLLFLPSPNQRFQGRHKRTMPQTKATLHPLALWKITAPDLTSPHPMFHYPASQTQRFQVRHECTIPQNKLNPILYTA
ncbi:hypothetical protein E2C01_100714 [Portunus trituberculatus]|uniref:Uncharacterized protein n=1 Tax=Portunus trituberculatus TaxID=210409 RepID=A0A5B7KEA3_PORTR|nr:hypothetical protein [Portunus trituberculatus]